MSNKAFDKINEIDRLIRQELRLGMNDGVFLQIEFIWGFEKFNTRPYHNYETWSGGYRVTDPHVMDTRWGRKGDRPLTVEAEDLDDAIGLWVKERRAVAERLAEAERAKATAASAAQK